MIKIFHKKYINVLVFILIFIFLAVIVDLFLVRNQFISGHDWIDYFKPAAIALVNGESPYASIEVFNPTWVFLPMIPLSLLPDEFSTSLMFLFHFVGYGIAAYRLKVPIINMVIFFTIQPIYFGAMLGQIDWMIPLGATLPPQIGIFFVMAKPQIGIGIAIYWLYEAFRVGGIKNVIKIFLPVTIAFTITFLLFGFYPLHSLQLREVWWNVSLWPYSIPIGLGFLVSAIMNKNSIQSLTTGAFLTPYLAPQSLAIPIFSTIQNRQVLISVVLGTWILWQFFLK